ncbi:23S rRNA pseudouridine1911/1915/1917 synthase [Actinobaculum suis]|uniref:Pseudouridine synthase n=1 Tax=Actinobaculum suis TaxID=1657 RepID=A0A0K9EV91_9ACTO|nr:RluA family pseudouridine synthase [Actinobaculum suis]KMY23811.1 pseudouridine synthase [Actinobaculum suis]MDY5153870.1 RluA family pseudouridine synthase [Actinobaculum suis]OCA93330.1 RNA pseudouridine synthase [Actinobaculum suis]OCA94486.1 RNA pseudouridine synthase [Actinobaculum suis]SDD99730.1 23S rRNA pseudouridine1911/1915/1917 synthase [Actinobaculum suis]
MTERRVYPIPDSFDGERIDLVLARITGMSRSSIARIIDEGQARLDGQQAVKSDVVTAGNVVEINLPAPRQVEPIGGVEIPLLYEDQDVVVVDKPAGLAAHPSLNFEGPDVLGALQEAGIPVAKSGPPERHGIVHRLDVGTSGCMVVAKSERAYSLLKREFHDRIPVKIYHAVVQGHPDPLSGTIDAPIKRDRRHQWKMAVQKGGRHAVTHYDTLEAMAGGTLVEVHLETGRTHQIRVHMSALNHPCVGDEMYGADPVLAKKLGLERQWLHATRLGFEHPDGTWREFTSQYPADLQGALDLMREGVFK